MTSDPPRPRHRGAIAGLVIGIAAIVFSFTGGGVILGLIGLIVMAVARAERSTMMRAAMVLCIVGIVLSIVIVIVRVSTAST